MQLLFSGDEADQNENQSTNQVLRPLCPPFSHKNLKPVVIDRNISDGSSNYTFPMDQEEESSYLRDEDSSLESGSEQDYNNNNNKEVNSIVESDDKTIFDEDETEVYVSLSDLILIHHVEEEEDGCKMWFQWIGRELTKQRRRQSCLLTTTRATRRTTTDDYPHEQHPFSVYQIK